MDKPLFIFLLSLFFLPLYPQKNDPVKIGLLIQNSKNPAAIQGAELAVKLANEKGGFKGRPFSLITKGMEGPWGTGSKMAVDLIFEDDVWALLGSHDGRNGHLVEQAATKATVVFVSAWSSDPTLSQAYVPWFFNCVPNDMQQADAILNEIFENKKYTSVTIIHDRAYDSRMALNSFLKSKRLSGRKTPVQLNYEEYLSKPEDLATLIRNSGSQCLVLFCSPSASLKVVRLMNQKKIDLPVFGTLSILNENELANSELIAFDHVNIACGLWSHSRTEAFRKLYLQTYGRNPGMVACYAFDSMNLLIEAIKTSGSPERELIQKALSEIRYEGITGLIEFDQLGNRATDNHVSFPEGGIPSEMAR